MAEIPSIRISICVLITSNENTFAIYFTNFVLYSATFDKMRNNFQIRISVDNFGVANGRNERNMSFYQAIKPSKLTFIYLA
jgi:hypothetical protein